MLSVRLPVNSKLLIVKLCGESKVICKFLTAWWEPGFGVPKPRGVQRSNAFEKQPKKETDYFLKSNING